MATGGGSVFAKQFAGRIKQVGRDGDVRASGAAGAGFGAAGGGGSRAAGSKAKAKSSAPPAKARTPSPAPVEDDDDEDAEDLGGGTMSCANRDLLRQMLQGANMESSSAVESSASAAPPASRAMPPTAGLKSVGATASAPALKAKASVVTASAPRAVASKAATLAAPAPKAAAAGATPVRVEANEGTMACANRDLLKQMLKSVDKRDESDMPHADVFTVDEFDGGFFSRAEEEDDVVQDSLGMSSRLVPGTPKSGTRHHGVPTISSPAGNRALPKALPASAKMNAVGPQTRAVSSSARPAGAKAKASVSKVMPAAAKSAAPQKVLTGPPRRAPPPGSYSAPRPGSRGGAAEHLQQVQEVLASPANRQGRTSAPSTPASAAGRAGGGRANSYAMLHNPRAGTKAAGPSPKSTSPVVQQAARPRCGPAAFDMLRKLDETSAQQQAGTAAEDEEDGFVMPDDLSDAGDQEEGLVDQDERSALVGRPRPVPLQSRGVTQVPARQGSASSLGSDLAGVGAAGGHNGSGDRESAADYVERVKKSFGAMAPVAPSANESSANHMAAHQPHEPEARRHSAGAAEKAKRQSAIAAADKGPPPPRARSSDPRAAVAAARAADLANATTGVGPGGAAARARSSEPRASVTFSRRAEAEYGDDDDSDDDDLSSVPLAGAGRGPSNDPWKVDVKSLVKEFAQEERARNVSAKTKTLAPRPPKAPAKATTAVPPHVAAVDHSDQADEPGGKLFFSRKPREVDYTPASLDEYKQKGYDKKEMSSLKTLGPDLDDENLLLKKAEKLKMKQFDKDLRRINKARMEAVAARGAPKAEPKAEPKQNARAKALQFAKQVPKPEPKARPPEARKAKEVVPEAPRAPTEAEKMQDDWDEIRQREKQHFDDVIKVHEIREFLNQLRL
mmetsp:Transcript_160699/g.293534  ORF Transcript_160699/g.293534 Transcript_160699/m.293534 type:complete len:904 (+) Transcript_160699:71-2782(+)